jgi:hypothetical protein
MAEESIAQIRHRKYGETATIPADCPWVDPPLWWNKGLRAWGELLTEQWEIAQKQKPTRGQLEGRRMLKMAQARANEIQRIAVEVLKEWEETNHGQDDRQQADARLHATAHRERQARLRTSEG